MKRSTWALLTLFVITEVAANWLAARYKVHVGPWLVPGGSFLIPVSLFLRDALQLKHPKPVLRMAFIVGAMVSALFNYEMARIALASVVAFVVCFATDTVVFTALRNRPLPWRLRLSNWAALPIDTLVFVPIAFGGLYSLGALIPGQLLVKLGMTEVGILFYLLFNRLTRRTV